ncbi:MAG: hypothetical protein ACTSV5_13740 [Promethearchaeota archaeon]
MSIINSESGCVVGFLMIMVYALLIICKIPFSLMWFLPVIYCFITTISSLDNPPKKANHYKTKKKNSDQDQHEKHPRVNSYIERSSVKNDIHTLVVDEFTPIETSQPKALFCQFCGTQRAKGAIYCFQCGAKLE